MGYYSDFKVSVFEVKEDGTLRRFEDEYSEQILKSLETISQYNFENMFEWNLYDCKWYEFDNDMTRLSLDYPEVVFRVDRWGEQDGDIACIMYMNGKNFEWRPEPLKLITSKDLFSLLQGQDPRPQTTCECKE